MPKTKFPGILMIGMPYVGKSTIGRIVADRLGFSFFDGDEEIEKSLPNRQKYLDNFGDDEYIKMEAKIIVSLPVQNSVISPGGSIIYSESAKRYLKSCFKVYLNASLDTIKKRITRIDIRGIVKLKKLGLDALYNERKHLFKSYCDVELDGDAGTPEEIAGIISSAYILRYFSKNKDKIRYTSTNGESKSSFSGALMLGLAPDKGLFVPDKIPFFSQDEIGLMKSVDYASMAFVLLKQYIDIPDIDFKQMCENAYNFSIPIEGDGDFFIARFDQGPSLSFKDFAMQLLAPMINYSAGKDLIILTATSGDTGGAVASAFKGISNSKVIILMPKDEITEIQRRQMTTYGDNVIAVLVQGKFDDCQALAKKAFQELKGFSSANSINIGRLLPQIVYYFWIYNKTKAKTFVVPSGNFGNIVAGAIAKRMGLPIKLVAAVNENDEVPKFLNTGSYIPLSPSKKCISNAMNIGNPSNLARLVWIYGGLMDETGKVIRSPDMKKLKEDVTAISITDEETRSAIKEAYKNGIVLEPHGAVGWAAIEKLKHEKELGKFVLLETAHPAKFPEELDAIGIKYDFPESLSALKILEEKYFVISPDIGELKQIVNKIYI
ncbi:threonine synthase [Candidatus Woesearchaeota archaeon]|nr:threonine synthase [Candidatus Woesearchaeota archaeon]